MTERLRSGNSFANSANISAKMSNDLTPRKTMLIIVIVVGCFAVLWPKVFYPMLVGSANQHIKPSPIDKTTGCCDVISETDVNTIKIMSELCRTIIKKDEDLPLTGREIVAKCQKAVLETCGIDISEVLQEQVRLGQSVKQILDEIRSLNGSLCLKYNFGVAPGSLGVPHRVTVKMSPASVRQERPLHLRSELVHPAFRERGRAIPQPQTSSPRTTTRVVEGRPGPIPGMRPTLGGAGHVVPPPKQSTGSMGLIMPIYTIGIVIFFTYTVLKIIFKKQPEALYPPVEPDPNFRREVFESNRGQAPKLTREGVSSKLGDAELDQLRQRLRETELAMERIVEQMAKVPLKLQNVVANGNVVQEEEQPSVKVLGMEMTASCEGGKKWSRPDSPVLPTSVPSAQEPVEPPQEIFLEGALPPQSHLLVADSATEAEKISTEEDPAVVLAGKMTLSVISLDSSENGTEEDKKLEERSSSNVSDEFEKIDVETDNVQPDSVQQLLEQIQNEIEEIDNENIITKIESTPLEHQKDLSDVPDSAILNQTEVGIIEKENDQQIDPTLSAIEPSDIKDSVIEKREIEQENEQQIDPILSATGNSDLNDSVTGKIDQQTDLTVPANQISDIIESAVEKIDVIEQPLDTEATNSKEINNIEAEPVSEVVTETDSNNREITEQLDDIQPSDTEKAISEDTNKENVVEKQEEVEPQNQIELEHLSEEILKLSSSAQPNNTVTEVLETPETIITEQPPSEDLKTEEPTASEALPSNGVSEPQISETTESNTSELSESNVSVINDVPESGEKPPAPQEDKPSEEKSEIVPIEATPKVESVVTPKSDANTTATPVSTSAEATESFEKLNEAISDLASEFRPRNDEKEEIEDEEAEDGDDEEEIEYEYEYEESDNDAVEDEIRNVNRLAESEDLGASERLNGENQDHSKYGTTSSVTLAENDISDEEDLVNEDDDEVVHEIIEYISDEEEEEEPVETNANHLPGPQ